MGTPQSNAPAPAPQPKLSPPSRSPSWPPTGRGCSRIFQYENAKTTKLLTSFLPRFPPGATPQDRTRVLIINVTPPPAVTGSPVQPRSLDFEVQPGVGLLPSLHLDGVSVIYHRTHPPRCRHERNNFSSTTSHQISYSVCYSTSQGWAPPKSTSGQGTCVLTQNSPSRV